MSDSRKIQRFKLGNGNWAALPGSGVTLDDILGVAAGWSEALKGIEKPWLCWNVDSNWNVVQQRLVRRVGWTPVVGFDPRVGAPPLERGAICIDFNSELRLPTMWMHFPLEFIFLMCDRLAFWHADFLMRFEKLERYARQFANLSDGEMAAVEPAQGWRTLLRPAQKRYWEVLGCSTRTASRSQFEHGCGWWMKFSDHPSNSVADRQLRSAYYWDCGVGIRYWHKHCGGKVVLIPEAEIQEGHFTGIGRSNYQRRSPKNYERNLSLELSLNNDLAAACAKLGISKMLNANEGE
jgi:hypothetical protein